MKILVSTIIGLLSMVAAPSSAATLNFEGVTNAIYTSPITRSGFNIGQIPTGNDQHFHEIDSTIFPNGVVNNGTGVLWNDSDARIFIESSTLGGTFALGTFDASAVGPSSQGAGATNILVSGFLNGNLVNLANFGIGSSFATFGGFSGTFDRIIFDGTNGHQYIIGTQIHVSDLS